MRKTKQRLKKWCPTGGDGGGKHKSGKYKGAGPVDQSDSVQYLCIKYTQLLCDNGGGSISGDYWCSHCSYAAWPSTIYHRLGACAVPAIKTPPARDECHKHLTRNQQQQQQLQLQLQLLRLLQQQQQQLQQHKFKDTPWRFCHRDDHLAVMSATFTAP